MMFQNMHGIWFENGRLFEREVNIWKYQYILCLASHLRNSTAGILHRIYFWKIDFLLTSRAIFGLRPVVSGQVKFIRNVIIKQGQVWRLILFVIRAGQRHQ